MKGTDVFKKTIEAYLNGIASNDPEFDKKFTSEGKSIDDCVTYILNTVQKSGCNGFTDDEIFGMALHYYDEEKIEIGKPIDCKVVVNHTIELTEEEKQAARKKALDEVMAKEMQRLTARQKKPVSGHEVQQASLF